LNCLQNKITESDEFQEYARDKAMRPLSGAVYNVASTDLEDTFELTK
jgi:hypothetical protein